MAFGFSVHFAKGVKNEKASPNKKRKTVKANFPSQQRITDSEAAARQRAADWSAGNDNDARWPKGDGESVTMQSGGYY